MKRTGAMTRSMLQPDVITLDCGAVEFREM